MDEDQYSFLKELVETTGPSGYEWHAQRVWRNRVAAAASAVATDSLGNCYATLHPGGIPRVMIEAHIDEIGFQVRYIDDNGFLFFAPIGHVDPSTLLGNRVRIMGPQGPVLGVIGRCPRHLQSEEVRETLPAITDLWIDIGASSRAAAEAWVSVGDAGGRCTGVDRLQGTVVAANSFDDRAGAYVVAEAFRALAAVHPAAEVVAVSSVQEEIGLRGAVVSAYTANTPIGIAVEVNWTTDEPDVPVTELGDLRMGKGPIFGKGANTNPRIFRRLVAAADAENIPYQIKADPEGTANDENVMQISRGGMATGLIKVPTRYLHTASEVLSTDDLDACVAVLTRFVQDLDGSIDLTPERH